MIECFFTWLAIHLADELMDSITIPLDVEIIACLFLFVIHLAFEDNKERNRTYEDHQFISEMDGKPSKKTFDHKGRSFMPNHKAQNFFRDFKQRAEAKR